MRRRYVWLTIAVVVLMVAALALASCGGTTTTTAAPTTTTAGPSTTAAGPSTTAAGGTVDAAALYAQYCGITGCHPDTLPGGSADDVKAAIQNGKGTEMPGFADKLDAAQIAAITAWVANGGK